MTVIFPPKGSALGDLANNVRKILSKDFETAQLPVLGMWACAWPQQSLLGCVTGGLAMGKLDNSP